MSFAEVSSHYLHISNLADNETLPEYSVHEDVIRNFNQIKSQLTSGMKQQSLGNFASPPRCYTLIYPQKNDSKRKNGVGQDGTGGKKPRSDGETGWLCYKGHKKYPYLPSLSSCRMCKEYITVGLKYSKGNQKEWRYGVHVPLHQLTPVDKKIVTDYVTNSRSLSFKREG